MGGRIVQPDKDFGSILADFESRIGKLERVDQTGFTRLLTQPAGSKHQQTNQNITSQTYASIGNTTLAFTLTQQTTIFCIANMAAVNSNATAGLFGYITFFVDGVNYGYRPAGQGLGLASVALFDSGNPGYTNASIYLSTVLQAGSHTVELKGYTDNAGTNFRVSWTDVYCFVIGA